MTSQLKPLRHPQNDLFVIDALDAIIKDDMPSMEYPFYSLSKKPDREVRRFEYKDKWIEFRPSVKGLPTIYDKVCQQALLNRLDPIFEPLFDEASFGYRRGRSTKDALKRVWYGIHQGNPPVFQQQTAVGIDHRGKDRSLEQAIG